MDFSLSSNLNTAKPVLSGALSSCHCPRLSKYNSISCRANKSGSTSETETTNLYKTLSLSSNKGIDEIKKAYRALALKYHPDVCHPSMKEESTRIFVQLHAAYKALSDSMMSEENDDRLSHIGHDQIEKKRWEEQINELKKRSNYRTTQKEGSWGSRIRGRNRENGVL